MSDFDITSADPEAGADEISALLLASGLDAWSPAGESADVLVARGADGRLAGCAVLLPLGDLGLLRSVAVAPEARGSGLGRRLVEELLARPAAQHLRSVYLLTTTASVFFERLGFESIAREHVDEVIKKTPQYRDECPTTAVVMRRT